MKYGRMRDLLSESVELRTNREREIWNKGQVDASIYMREVAVSGGYLARGVRVPDMVPSDWALEELLEQADHALGGLTDEEDAIYRKSFNNTCLGGYPPRDA